MLLAMNIQNLQLAIFAGKKSHNLFIMRVQTHKGFQTFAYKTTTKRAELAYIPMTRFSSDVMDPIYFGIQNFLIIYFVNYTTLDKRESMRLKNFKKRNLKSFLLIYTKNLN